MRVLIAPDKFKGTLSAVEVAQIIGEVLTEHGHEVVRAPMADGGDGTLDVIIAAGAVPRQVPACDAHLRAFDATVAEHDGRVIVEMARICGLVGVADLPTDPWTASSRGVGLAVLGVIESGVTDVVVCLGGSASVDGGIGMLQALGVSIRDANGAEVTPDLRGLLRATVIDVPSLNGSTITQGVSWHAMVDVDAPLCGLHGALAFAEQKGVPRDRFNEVDAALRRWAGLLASVRGVDPRDLPGAGAAGGLGAALTSVLGASVERGADAIADLINLDDALSDCDAVITGEGRFDGTTASGKAPWVVIERATARGLPVHVIAGSVGEGAPRQAVASVTACTQGVGDPRAALIDATKRWCRSMTG